MKHITLRRIKIGSLILAGACTFGLLVVVGYFIYLKVDLPSLASISDYDPPRVTRLYSDDGELVGELYLERRTVVPIEAIPKHVIHAFLAAEDAKFYEHEGIDYFGILRAALKNLRPGAHLQGASTITQQTVKTMVTGPERSYTRKMREALLARELEQLLTKDEILYLYLNQINFGSGAYGVEEAARTYFAKPVGELTLGEAAFLSCIPKNPSHYTLSANPEAAKQRQLYVLTQMEQNGWVTPEQAEQARREKVPSPPPPPPFLGAGPHYVEHASKLLAAKYGEQEVRTRGLTVYLGMNARMQASAHHALRLGLEALARRQGYPGASRRIEVDRLARYREALHEAFAAKLKKLHFYDAQAGRTPGAYIWDLSNIGTQTLANEGLVGRALALVPLAEGARVMGLVDKVDATGKNIGIDLGARRVSIDFKTLSWARRFSPTAATPPPHNPTEVVRPGDLVTIDIVSAPSSRRPKRPLIAELVPEPVTQGALIAIDPYSRLVRAVVGGYRAQAGELNRALQSLRQPGSAFKPIVYAAALAERVITPASLCADTPVMIRDPWTGKPWKPDNYEDGRYDGNITYRTALMRSKNTCSVKLLEKTKPETVIALAKAMGIASPLPDNLTLALGTGDVRPIELANSYATIAAGGLYAEPIFIRKVVALDGTVLEENQAEPTPALDPATAFVLTTMMRSVVEEGTATKALVLDRPLAGKTGTSQEARNVWFSGFSAELVATVWVGLDDNKPMGRLTGGSAALPIWIDFMGRALSGTPASSLGLPPEDVVLVKVDPDTGNPSSEPSAIEEAFIAGTEPTEQNQALPSIFIEDEALND